MPKTVHHPRNNDRVRVHFTDGRVWEGRISHVRLRGPETVGYGIVVEQTIGTDVRTPFASVFIHPSPKVKRVEPVERRARPEPPADSLPTY